MAVGCPEDLNSWLDDDSRISREKLDEWSRFNFTAAFGGITNMLELIP